ncbi:reverse transcriptase domain-containing protein [Phytohabitans sp. ZYX-F-186]|uniref:Reverse transcriptase domain-containing protein n=1 Tax=Phytohabitans maris TaxID=3071409 RepID=A0ABU0ZKS3_9ACTN|nr:reverse transcriptase domain-containing protein [Phytohabitans sp. ZYX-F-186]MDQ7907651.1 reverse transcriptase domain-containing protein [Phytohabitans sp. ZYX-F-186]
MKAFLKAGILSEDGVHRDTHTGTPQGNILSPLLANVALSVLDEHIARAPGGPAASPYERAKRRRQGLPNYRLCRYADDWCLTVSGTRAHAEALREEIAEVLAGMGLRLSPAKTLITHIDESLDFLGWRIQRHRKRGTSKYYVYVYPAKKALAAVTAKVKAICWQNTNQPLVELLLQLNQMLGGWTAYFKWGCSSATFRYLRAYLWKRVIGWQGRKHRHATWRTLRRRYGRWPANGDVILFDPANTHQALPLPADKDPNAVAQHSMRNVRNPPGRVESPVPGQQARRVREAARGNGPAERPAPRPGPTSPVRVNSPG